MTQVNTAGILTGGPITTSGTVNVNATISPQGRLTLASATPVMSSTQSAKTTIYYTPYIGNLVPIYDGTNMVPTACAGYSYNNKLGFHYIQALEGGNGTSASTIFGAPYLA
jgi:hypothetical protein